MQLSERKCVPCQGGVPPLKGVELAALAGQLGHEWQIVEEHHLEKQYKFTNFREALDFANAIGAVAESEQHHPELTLTWGRVTVRIWTHKINGLTESDFVLAAKIEDMKQRSEKKQGPCLQRPPEDGTPASGGPTYSTPPTAG